MTSTHLVRPVPAASRALAVASVTDQGGDPAGETDSLAACLLAALPAAERVLAIGAGAEALGQAYRRRHPWAEWQALPWSETGFAAGAAQAELVVVADGFAGSDDPLGALRVLAEACAAGTRLFAALGNGTRAEAVLHLVEGDLSEGAGGAPACRAFASPPSAYKLLMDAGWMPHLAAGTPAGAAATGLLAPALGALAEALALPRATLERRLGLGGLVVEAIRAFEPAAAAVPGRAASFAVVVPTTRERQLHLNVACSPGLSELGAQIVPISGASSPADALARALPRLDADWVLLCHQDVYFPAGFGHRLDALLEAIPAEAHAKTLIGFAGMAVDAARQGYTEAGFVIDRLHRFDHAASAAAVSIDELAVVFSRRSVHRIDPALGWHLWATGLCLAAICEHQVFPRIVRLPLFHNSLNDYSLPPAFHASAARLAASFPAFGPIPTLCGTIDAAFLARHAAAVPQPVALPAPANAASTASTANTANSSAAPHAESAAAAQAAPAAAVANRCCLCGEAVAAWRPHPHLGRRSEFMKLLDAVGSDLSVYQCPACESNDRERHLWLYMNAIGLPQRLASMRVLHVAPEPSIEAIFEQLVPLDYVRGDLHPQRAGHVALDVEALGFTDAGFDLVLCNHVLEHVASPERALAELFRVLAPGGTLIVQTPYAPALVHTLELNRPVSAAFAKLFYGQGDHVRLFGADLAERIRAAGFRGGLLPHAELLGELDARAHGVNGREPFFCFTR